jgi:hypothetical protein
MLGLGTAGFVLKAQANSIGWEALAFEQLNQGSYVSMINSTTNGAVSFFNSSTPVTISVDATVTNTANKIVARDASGNFSAGTITANLAGNVNGNLTGNVTGSVTGNAGTATRLQTARTINGISFDGSSNITLPINDTTKVSLTGDSMTGFLTLAANPVNSLHAATKQYVDGRVPGFSFISSASFSTSGFTNQVGSFNNGANFFDVFPPAGKTMGNLLAFIPSIHVIHFNGIVNFDDSLRCTYSYFGDRIRVYVQNTEQRSTPAANYLVIWS